MFVRCLISAQERFPIAALLRWLSALGLVLVQGFAAGFIALVGSVVLASEVVEQETRQVDLAVLVWLHQFESPALDATARFASALGSEILLAIAGVLLVILAFQRQWSAAAGLAIVLVGASILNSLLKQMIQRARPEPLAGIIPAQGFSFPSGHAMVATAFYGYLAILAWRRWRGWRRVATTGLLVTVILAISLSRIYLGAHYITDIVAGWIAGFLWADAVALGAALLRRRHPPAELSSASHQSVVEVAGAQKRRDRS